MVKWRARKRMIFSVFKSGGDLEDRMRFEVLLLMILWEEKSKVLLGPDIFFELGDEIEGRWLEPVFKSGEDLVGGLNTDGRSFLRW